MMENELNKKYDQERGIVITYDKKGRQFVSFPVAGVPIAQWEEWNKVCEEQFNSGRWQMIYLDFKLNHAMQSLIEPPVPQEEQQEKKDVTLLSGEKIENE